MHICSSFLSLFFQFIIVLFSRHCVPDELFQPTVIWCLGYLICIWIHKMVKSLCLRLLFAFCIIMENHWIPCKFWRYQPKAREKLLWMRHIRIVCIYTLSKLQLYDFWKSIKHLLIYIWPIKDFKQVHLTIFFSESYNHLWDLWHLLIDVEIIKCSCLWKKYAILNLLFHFYNCCIPARLGNQPDPRPDNTLLWVVPKSII